jgi:HPt (histidine-containing phosphotransfer) domain-containing protein
MSHGEYNEMNSGDASSRTPKSVIFDREEFVSRSLGNIELSRYVATIFIENGPEYIESIRKALSDQDAGALRQSAHKLKGATATMALPALSEIAHRLEEFAETEQMEKATRLLPELQQQFEQAVEALRKLFVTPSGTSRL